MVRQYLEQFINLITQLLIFAIFARVVLSWMRIQHGGRLYLLLLDITEPILGFFRRLIPPLGGVLDLSPIFAFLAIDIVRAVLLKVI